MKIKRPEFNFPVKESLKFLINKCWDQEPDERPAADEIFNALAYGADPILGDADEDKQRFYLEDVDKEAIQDYIELIKDDYAFDDEKSSLKAIKDLNSKIDQMQARVDDLQQENHKF